MKADKNVFFCRKCRHSIVAPKTMCKGVPRNIGLVAHWDGFQLTRHTSRSCWVVEVQILNCGNNGSLNILPVLFIPLYSVDEVYLSRIREEKTLFLQPLVLDLETLFLEGFATTFVYPAQLISRLLSVEMRTPIILRVILMMFTSNRPDQTKIGMLKNSRESPCRRCVYYSSIQNGRYKYGNNRQQFIQGIPRHSSDVLFYTLTKWKHAPSNKEKEAILQEGGMSRVVCTSVHSSRPSVTSNKVRVCPIRVNVLLTLDRVNLDLLCPQWLPHRCHVGWLGLLWAHIGWLRGAYACQRGTYACRRGAYACRKGAYAYVRGAYEILWGAYGCRRGTYACRRGAYSWLRGTYGCLWGT
jgi:hypothetical protein